LFENVRFVGGRGDGSVIAERSEAIRETSGRSLLPSMAAFEKDLKDTCRRSGIGCRRARIIRRPCGSSRYRGTTDEGSGLQTVLIEEAVDRRFEVSDGEKGAAPEAALGQDGE
jgi:hypothetical protein